MGNLTYSFFSTPHREYVKKCGRGAALALSQVLGSLPCEMRHEEIQKLEQAAVTAKKTKHMKLFLWLAKRSKEVLDISPDGYQFLIVKQWEDGE